MSDLQTPALSRRLTVGSLQRIPSALLAITLLLGCLSVAQPLRAAPDMSQYELAFGDEFNGTELDSSKWNTGLLWGPYQPINNEEQFYVDILGMHRGFDFSPFEFTGTSLKIVATPTSASQQPPDRPAENDAVWDRFPEYRYNGPTTSGPGYQALDVGYLSGIITSYDTFRFTHGYAETRMKLPAGKGLWPAFWALTSFYVEDVPEIDVMEFLGDQTDRVYHTYHYFEPKNNWTQISTPSYTTLAENFTDDWHVFGMQWGPTEIIWYVDNVETRRIDTSEYDIANQAMYLLANLAVGGGWPGSPNADTVFPAELEIDYIRAYRRKAVDIITPAVLDDEFQLVFEDTFSGNAVDSSKWNSSFLWGPYLSINNEEQIYPDMLGEHQNYDVNPFSVNDGLLSITATAVEESLLPERQTENSAQFTNNSTWSRNSGYRGDPTSPDYYVPGYVSGLLTTYDSFKFVNGYAEISARLPHGSGLWPAFWLLNGYYVGQQPEIDIMEFRGERRDEIVHSYHYFTSEGLQSESYVTQGTDYTAGFHTYGVHWQPGKIDWYIDGRLVHSTSGEKVSSQVMYLILNLAVGGNFVAEVDPVALPASYEVDYVRVWQRRIADDARPTNVSPIASDDSAGPVEAGTALSIAVLDNDNDSDGYIDGDTLAITQQPTEGTASVTPGGLIQYVHAGGTTSGTDTLRYSVKDDAGETSNEAMVTIAIIESRAANIPPVAIEDTVGPLYIGGSLTFSALANDSDSDGELIPASLTIVDGPLTGIAIADPSGQITYTHDGTPGTLQDVFSYMVQDDDGAVSNVATVRIAPFQEPEPTQCPDTMSLGTLSRGVAASDNATGNGWLMWSRENVRTRFSPRPLFGNAEHLIAVKLVSGTWHVDNNYTLTPFTPASDDCLVATLDFDADTASPLVGVDQIVNGIDSGFDSGDMIITPNWWNGAYNPGEFGIAGTSIGDARNVVTQCPDTMPLGVLSRGVAASDNATGTGWLMWSRENVRTRFSPQPLFGNAEHLIAVKLVSGTWHVDNNYTLTPFTPASDDCLVAALDFDADTASPLVGVDQIVNGIDSGFDSGDMIITPNWWNGAYNPGEFGIAGTSIGDAWYVVTQCPDTMPLGVLSRGVAASDDATGTGWLMWSSENVRTRFSPQPLFGNAEHLIAVKLVSDTWHVDNNYTLTPFTPARDDCLVAALDFDADTATPLIGVDQIVNGIDSGFDSGDMIITPNWWNGAYNPGEFGIAGTSIGDARYVVTQCPDTMPLGTLSRGVAASDNATGSGWLMWSRENVRTRFSPRPLFGNAEQLIAVKLVSDTWHVDNNYTLTPFTPASDDCLVAALDFDADTATPLIGVDQIVNGIDSGFDSGDMIITPNRWNGFFNAGEFGISGTSIQ